MIKLYRNHNGQSKIIRLGTETSKTNWSEQNNKGITTYAAVLMRQFNPKETSTKEKSTQEISK